MYLKSFFLAVSYFFLKFTFAFSVEAFGTAWAVDDEDECPAPPPVPDICEDFGLMTEKVGYEEHVVAVLKGKLFKSGTLVRLVR